MQCESCYRKERRRDAKTSDAQVGFHQSPQPLKLPFLNHTENRKGPASPPSGKMSDFDPKAPTPRGQSVPETKRRLEKRGEMDNMGPELHRTQRLADDAGVVQPFGRSGHKPQTKLMQPQTCHWRTMHLFMDS